MKRTIAVMLLLTMNIIFAQEEKIDTDRPDQTETPSIVPVNRFQMENGFTHKYEATEGNRRFELPSSLWKFGVTKNLELRVITTILYEKQPQSTQQGLEPIIIGMKHKLWEEKGMLPQTSVIGQVLLPDLSAKTLKAEYLAPELRFLFENTITERTDLGYNISIQWDGEHTKPEYDYTFSPSVELNDQLKVYIESYGFLKVSRHSEHWIDGGVMLLLTDDVQLDISGGYELTAHQGHRHSTYESIGFSFRL